MYLPVVQGGEAHDLGGAGSEGGAAGTALPRGGGRRRVGEGDGDRIPGGNPPALAGGQPRHLGAPNQPPVLASAGAGAVGCRGRRRGLRFLCRGLGPGRGFAWWGRRQPCGAHG